MIDRRIKFHGLLCEILSCPIEGERCRCYFQPPESVKMSYPAIVYSLAEISKLIEGKRIKPTAILTFDSTRVNAKNLAELEEILYGKDPTSPEGDDGVEPRLPLPDEVIEIMSKENP